jgi:hypothetical protein
MPWSNRTEIRHNFRLAVGVSVASAFVLVASVFFVVALVDTLMVH